MTIKEIKKEAKIRTKGIYLNLVVINIFYSLIVAALTYAVSMAAANTGSDTLGSILSLLIGIITIPFSYGVLVSTMKFVRGESVSATEFINIGLKNIAKVWKLTLRTFTKLLLPLILVIITMIISIAYFVAKAFSTTVTSIEPITVIIFLAFIASYIWLLVKSLSYVFSNYLLNDRPEAKSVDLLNESANLMKGNKLKYVGLILSFIGWLLLSALVEYLISAFISTDIGSVAQLIFSALLAPYMAASQIIFYEDKLDSATTETADNNTITEE